MRASALPAERPMGLFAVIRARNSSDLTAQAARTLVHDAGAQSGRRYCMALSGGRVAGSFFAAIVAEAKRQSISLDHLEFFWADERCVSPTDPESNFALAQERLFLPLHIRPAQIHRIRGEVSPDQAAAEAEADLLAMAPAANGGQPVLDLVHLGMGEDGHIASLFPGEGDQLEASARVYRPVVGPKPPPRRITLGYATLAAARQVWVIASGAGKQQALHRSLTEAMSTPLGRLLSLRSITTIYTDCPLD